MLTLGCVTGESVEEWAAYLELESKHAAWALWKAELCTEWNGSHLWMAYCDGVDVDDRAVTVVCEYCGSSFGDTHGDLYDLMYGEIDGVPVSEGICLTLLTIESPVNVTVEWRRIGWEYVEYEAEVVISSRR